MELKMPYSNEYPASPPPANPTSVTTDTTLVSKPRLLIIGGTGSLGHVLVDRYKNDYHIYIYSRDENKQWHMKHKFQYPNIEYIIGDISDTFRLKSILHRTVPNYIIVAAALKHIDICEYNTYESIKTNILGIQNVIESITVSKRALPDLECVLFVSTDKACSPLNVYGMCKSISERIVIEKSLDDNPTRFVVVRYGNVLSSRGSLLPKFHDFGRDPSKESFTVTHKDMTRFFMSLEQSVDLIHHAMIDGENGFTYIPILPSYSIQQIAEIFSEIYNKPIVYTGLRPGEKMHEELINEMELRRTKKEGDYFAIASPYSTEEFSNLGIQEYTSHSQLCDDRELLRRYIDEAEIV